MSLKNINTFGLAHAGYTLDQVMSALGISEGRAKKLRDLHVIRRIPGTGRGKRERFAGFDIEFLASARVRPFPTSVPALVCSMGVEPEHDRVPSMYFEHSGKNQGAELRACLDALAEAGEHDLIQAINNRSACVSGYWKVRDDNARALCSGGVIVASYTGFVLDGGRVLGEVPNLRREDGARAFVVRPFEPDERLTFCHTYRQPKEGPVVEFISETA